MPVFWDIEASVFCDAPGCKSRFTTVGDTPRQCVAWIKQAGWLYRKSIDDGHIMVRCPDHQMITHDMEEEDVRDNP